LIKAMFCPAECVGQLSRAKENPIIAPLKNHPWEAKAAFNPGALYEDGKVHILYRAMSEDNTSVFGYAASADGIHIDYRHSEPVYEPRESFEQKLVPGGNSGCEDPRLTKIKDTVYMLYTAFDGKHPPRIALTSISLKNFLAQVWDWTKPVLISPPEFDNKDACVFPEKVKGKYLIFHRFGNNIDITLTPSLDFDGKTWLEEHIWLSPRRGMWDSLKVGIAAPPIKQKRVGFCFITEFPKKTATIASAPCCLTSIIRQKLSAGQTNRFFRPRRLMKKPDRYPMWFSLAASR